MRVKGRWILLALMAVGLALLASASLVERPAELREAAELPPAPSATHWAAESAALPEMPNAAPQAQTADTSPKADTWRLRKYTVRSRP